jgi:hypothetical protein
MEKKPEQQYSFIRIIFLLIAFGLFFVLGFFYSEFSKEQIYFSKIQADAPYQKEIEKIISPLRYSGIADLNRPEVYLTIDFDRKQWTLKNIHTFDKEGNLLLAEGKYGLCGDLAAYTYQKLTDILDKQRFVINFVKVYESGYFSPPISTHYVLCIIDRKKFDKKNKLVPKIYVLDPSFRRYGEISMFENYIPVEYKTSLYFFENKSPNETFKAGAATPLYISRHTLVSLGIDSANNKFDKDNFKLKLTCVKRHSFMLHDVLTLEIQDGQYSENEDKENISRYLDGKTYAVLKKRCKELFRNIQR